MMLSNVYADCMRLMIEDSDKNVSEIWAYKDVNPVCRFSLEKDAWCPYQKNSEYANDAVIKEAAIDWDRARALMSTNRCFDIEYEYYALCDRLIATSIRFHDDTPKKGSIVVTGKITGGLESITGPMVMTSDGVMYGVHIIGSPNTLWMTTLGTECWEYYKKPQIGIKRIDSMQAVDILRKAATGEYKAYEIKFNYHIKDTSDSIKCVVDEVYIKYEEKEKEDNMRYIYKTFEKVATKVDWVNSNAEISDTAGNTYTLDRVTDIYLGPTRSFSKITFARAVNVLLHNNPDKLKVGAVISPISTHIVRMRILVDEESELQKLKEENERLRDKQNKQKALLNSTYGVSALGWSDMWPTSMIDIPSRQNGKMARLKEFVKKCNLTVPECIYCMNDIAATKKIHDSEKEKENMKFLIPKIKKVLYNEPAVIVFWEDDTKTVVRAQDGDPYDKEKGLAMAISKKALGNDRNYYETFIRSKAVPRPKKGKKE